MEPTANVSLSERFDTQTGNVNRRLFDEGEQPIRNDEAHQSQQQIGQE